MTLKRYTRNSKPITVNYGLVSELDYIFDYIQKDNPAVLDIVKRIRHKDPDRIIEEATRTVCRLIKYPFTWKGKPSTERKVLIFKAAGPIYHFELSSKYGWLKPAQTLRVKYGLCIDTSLLLASLLLAKNIPCKVVLGAIIDAKTKQFLGFHAWVETTYKNKICIIETTAGPNPLPIIDKAAAERGYRGIIYDGFAWFDDQEYFEDVKKLKKYDKLTRGVVEWEFENPSH
ncbi:hypothetical protein DRJ17_04530 [Candidatus Woesearchaeota archaeon]|mgnify:CR=1 FL=1|nr:MAG: hypothetical protein DRJ17_04530 [Candidatus Woesearchaeota archaeon]